MKSGVWGSHFVVSGVVDHFPVQAFSYRFCSSESFLSKLAGLSSPHFQSSSASILTHITGSICYKSSQPVHVSTTTPGVFGDQVKTKAQQKQNQSPAISGTFSSRTLTSGTSSSYEQTFQDVSEKQEKGRVLIYQYHYRSVLRSPEIQTDNSC